MQAEDKNNKGDYEGARTYGRTALACNILAIVLYIVMIISVVGGVLGYYFNFQQLLFDRIVKPFQDIKIPNVFKGLNSSYV